MWIPTRGLQGLLCRQQTQLLSAQVARLQSCSRSAGFLLQANKVLADSMMACWRRRGADAVGGGGSGAGGRDADGIRGCRRGARRGTGP